MPDDTPRIDSPSDASSPSDLSFPVRAMAAGVAHEFNNLLGAILASAEQALESGDPLEHRRALRLIIDRVDRACVITANLLSFACQDFIEPRPTDLASLLDDALVVMETRLRAAGVSVVRRLKPLPEVECDPTRMERVFLNLFANAVESMTIPGGTLTVELLPDESWAVVRISDTGSGIPPELLPRVFEPFLTTKGVLAGGDTPALGLGLSVCQGILRMHGGSITLQSSPHGTVVTVSLPLKPAANNRGAHHER